MEIDVQTATLLPSISSGEHRSAAYDRSVRTFRANRRMLDLLGANPRVAELPIPIELRMLVGGGFVEVEGCVFFRRFFPDDRADGLSLYPDRTGYECTVNSLHLEDYLDADAPRDARSLAITARDAAHLLLDRLEPFSSEPFRVIASVRDDGSSVLRFHKVRDGESWLADDLEGYEDEAILVEDR